jgi:hypothetical protein
VQERRKEKKDEKRLFFMLLKKLFRFSHNFFFSLFFDATTNRPKPVFQMTLVKKVVGYIALDRVLEHLSRT